MEENGKKEISRNRPFSRVSCAFVRVLPGENGNPQYHQNEIKFYSFHFPTAEISDQLIIYIVIWIYYLLLI